MHNAIFVNLPVTDLPRAQTFYQALGFAIEPAYTTEQAACLRIGDAIFAMLLVRPFFQTFTDKTIVEPATHVQILPCLSCESRDAVDRVVAAARAAGGTVPDAPDAYPGMYGHAFTDPDGHAWGLIHVEPGAHAAAEAS
ncbi:VOC family protein [Burkholderia multivorans]|uniref:VOC family protein n=1 Tax=Burkholderia multivorans TaxID=87883 RepID=UPI0009E0D28D|nr:VOC family protein [Burkholderia multivorans]SAJ63251.1 glyoxalase/bleomycin resistance protein/dioxygenase [Burkholderia multivorans]SAJ92150.1 glyoxalase/bleomycin resistance protein/dioxygenase [Burkholderia multivorans]HEM7810071.1 glyoxalase/bleomycin resistance/extradiol dioxygenase family protein [Burkholderia multivorans]HEM7815024.1 glyoxalase/bleomycin resistance/extradiol dioxygenase family protein [Burkholderia multivorans]HEM7820376.1 glyoxalase/bleomycin resistance/extradiol d